MIYRQWNGRTSTGARQATTALRLYASASSMSAASRIQKPPMCCLVSRNGPSVMKMFVSGDSTLGMGRLKSVPPFALLLETRLNHLPDFESGRIIVVGKRRVP